MDVSLMFAATDAVGLILAIGGAVIPLILVCVMVRAFCRIASSVCAAAQALADMAHWQRQTAQQLHGILSALTAQSSGGETVA